MAYDVTGRRRPTKPKKQARIQKRKRDDVDVEKLSQAVTDLVCLSFESPMLSKRTDSRSRTQQHLSPSLLTFPSPNPPRPA